MSSKKLLILNGSPRKNGTSASFGNTIKRLAEEQGNNAEILHIIDYFEKEKDIEKIKAKLAESDVICLVSPLYVDSLPYPVISFLENIKQQFKKELEEKYFFAIGQSAFPYVSCLDTLLGCCRCFSEAAGMKWLGGLGYGGGVMINGKPIESLGSKGRKIALAFKLALENAFSEREIDERAQQLMTFDLPRILSKPMAAFLNHKARKIALKNGVTDLSAKAYLE